MRTLKPKIGIALLAVTLGVTAGHAQAQPGDSSALAVQPVVTPLYTGNSGATNGDLGTPAANDRALAGAQDLSPEVTDARRSYWQPFFNLTSVLDTNPLGVGNTVSLAPWGSFYGGADLHWSSHRSDLSVNYLGGGELSQYTTEDGPIQQLALGEKLSWRHAVISLFDQFGYFPAAVSEFYVPTGADLSANREASLQPAFLPNQSIVSTLGQELTNSFVGELDVPLNQRSSLTLLGSYSVLRFFKSNFLDLNDTTVQAGFNHHVTRNNTLALLYRLTAFRFSNVYQPMDGHVVQLAFGRQVTGRMSFQVAAGPELAFFRTVASQTSSISAQPTVVLFKRVYWSLDTSMTYDIGRTVFKLGYGHSLTDGAGFLTGAVTDQGSGSIDTPLSRGLTAEFIGGYARNQGLMQTTQRPANEIYKDWFAGVTINHALSRRASIFLSYQVQRQATNFVCAGIACGSQFTRQLVSVGLTGRLQARPIE
jgi:hypothetical protein